MHDPAPRRYRFGSFEVDFNTGELLQRGLRRRVSGQPLQILEMLIAHPGQVVSREELRNRLWKDDTFVDFERGLNAAVNRLREALGDSASSPCYIETLPRMGYRFMGELSEVPPATRGVAPSDQEVRTDGNRVDVGADFPLPSTTPIPARFGQWRRFVPWVAFGLLFAGVTVNYALRRRAHFALASRDTVLLADFQNMTREPVFDDTLRQGLFVGLEQSPYLQTVSDRKAAAVLAQMGRSPEEKLIGTMALELCQRSAAKAVVEGSIASIGNSYVIGLTALRCDTGEAIAHEQARANGKDQVIDALGDATTRLRTRLGESLQSIKQYDVPLEQATTPSLEALKAYSQGFAVWDRKGDEASVVFFQRAVELDPNFAMAYGALAAAYENQGETRLAEKNAATAYQLRNRVGELERTLIESWRESFVTGDLEKAATVSELAARTYPSAPRLLNDLGTIYGDLGQYERAVPLLQEADRLYPGEATSTNLMVSLMALGRTVQAGSVLKEARTRHYSSPGLVQASYWLAFLNGDQGEMGQIVESSAGLSGAQGLLKCEEAKTEAYYGHFSKAHQLAHEAAQMERASNAEAAGTCLAAEALIEAEAGDFAAARATITEALSSSQDQSVTTLAALVKARLGETSAALAMAQDLSRKRPADTFVQKYWAPLIRAEVELDQHHSANALSILAAIAPMDNSAPDELEISTLYPVYARGRAYLAAGNGFAAAQEFQKVIDHPGMVLNFPLGALALLGRARADTQGGNRAKAQRDYAEFLELWKTADPRISLAAKARHEAEELTDQSSQASATQ